jgi:hypothetical protein
MKTTQTKIEFARLPKDYTGLCRMLTPRPIHDKVDFENVTEITDAMAGHKLTADQEDYFDLLCRLIEDYDKEHAQLDTPKAHRAGRLATPFGRERHERGGLGAAAGRSPHAWRDDSARRTAVDAGARPHAGQTF